MLAREIPLLDEGPGCKDRSFSGAGGGAATEPRSGAGTAFLRRAPLGSNPGAGCCTARASAHGASTGQDGKRKGELGNVYRRAGRLEAPLKSCEAFFRRSAPSSSEDEFLYNLGSQRAAGRKS